MKANSEHINQLIAGCRKSDKKCQFELYQQYYKAMYNTALRIVNDEFEAEDIMQEAFMNCFTKIDTYKGEVAFGAWLKKIVINKSLTSLKKIKKKSEVQLKDLEYKLKDTTDEQMGVAEDEINDQVKMIQRAVGDLQENYRVALQLSLFEGYDNEEIAEIMQISNENCRTTISRAKTKLRQALQHSTLVY
ncbi:RNA polymerase sigma factor [Namhaeicola litoreus]|uniref:RNA polymerase sigma factor n=1 Tax=Namhaeicola litoreus TaxID=1052145 RepID=A0ABW3Y6L4_9FLAO